MNRSLFWLISGVTLLMVTACGGGSQASPELVLSASGATIAEGATGTLAVAATRQNGEGGVITLSLMGAPSGITGSGTIANGAATGSLAVQVAATVPQGTYPLTVQGSDGTLQRSSACSLVVTGPVALWRFDYPKEFFAVQDGDGPWTAISPTGGDYTFAVNQGRCGVAYVDPAGGSTEVKLMYGLVGQMVNFDSRTTATNLMASGACTGLAPTERGEVSLGFEGFTTMSSYGWSILGLAPGLHDLIAVAQDAAFQPTRAIIHRDLVVGPTPLPASATTLAFGSESMDVTPATLTVTGLQPNDWPDVESELQTAHGEAFLSDGTKLSDSTWTIHGLPAGALASSDRQIVKLGLGQRDSTGQLVPNVVRSVSVLRKTSGDLTLAVPPPLVIPTITTATASPYLRLRTQWTDTTYSGETAAIYRQESANIWRIIRLPGFGGEDLTFPDFTGVAGWSNSWGLAPGVSLTVVIRELGSNWPSWPPADGTQDFQAVQTYTFTP